jgi:hypothetical protein
MAKMRAVDAAMYVLEKEGITTAFGVPGRQLTRSIPQCVSTEASVTFWLVTLKALPYGGRLYAVQRQEILASALAPLDRRALT